MYVLHKIINHTGKQYFSVTFRMSEDSYKLDSQHCFPGKADVMSFPFWEGAFETWNTLPERWDLIYRMPCELVIEGDKCSLCEGIVFIHIFITIQYK